MTHFGILCPPSTGHLNPMTALGRELQRRGHCVTLFGIADAQSKALVAGLNFCMIGESQHPHGVSAQSLAKLGQLSGFAALQYTMSLMKEGVNLLLREAPKALREAGVEALLVDQFIVEGETIAEFLQIPFITVCNALPVNAEDDIPPFFTDWRYNPAWWARLRNRCAYLLMKPLTKPITQILDTYRQKWSLPLYSQTPDKDTFSQLAQLSQLPKEFDFPRQSLPKCFHFTGPYQDSTGREPIPFPYEKLTGQPLIYASMGTIQNSLLEIFQTIASVCVGLDTQLVISLGKESGSEPLQGLPGSPIIVSYAPQLELLEKATLTITHAGLNTVLESLNNGIPMVAIPIANDQPAVAARIAWSGAGEFVPVASVSVPKLRTAIKQVLEQDSYKQNALRLQSAIHHSGGVSRAADIIEQAITTGKPVFLSKDK
jgi:zeaxanthin glucosyltransferase